MSKIVDVRKARRHLPRLLEEAANGEDTVIAKAGEPKVRLVPVESSPKRRSGFMPPGWGSLSDSFFFDPLPEEELRRWEQGA